MESEDRRSAQRELTFTRRSIERRHAGWPNFEALLATARHALALLIVIAGLAGGCSSNQPDTTGHTDLTTTTGPAVVPDRVSLCTDPSGDGQGGDLTKVELAIEGEVLHVRWTTVDVPTSDTYAYYVNLRGTFPQIALKVVGDEVSAFVVPGAGRPQKNLPDGYTTGTTTVSLDVPLADLGVESVPFAYHAVVSIDGTDVDTCYGLFPDS